MSFSCQFCYQGFATARGLTQHVQRMPKCNAAAKVSLGLTGSSAHSSKRPATAKKAPPVASMPAAKKTKLPTPTSPKSPFSSVPVSSLGKTPQEHEAIAARLQEAMVEDRLARAQIMGNFDKSATSKLAEVEEDSKMPAQPRDTQHDDVSLVDDAAFWSTDDGGSEASGDYFDKEYAADLAKQREAIRAWTAGEGPLIRTLASERRSHQEQQALAGLLFDDWNNDQVINAEPNTQMRDDFRAFCANSHENNMLQLTKVQLRSIKLLHTLKQKKSPLNGFDALMEWFHRERGNIQPHQGMQSVAGYLSRDVIMTTIKARYNTADKFPTIVPIKLPISHAKVEVVVHNAWNCIVSLLTDPRVEDDDYNFVDNNPFAPPKLLPTIIGEFHTGRAHRQAYTKYITDPERQILMPFILYIDGAVTGQMSNLPITAMRLALGIHTRNYRQNEYAWSTLGIVPEVSQPGSRGKAIYKESGHIESLVDELLHQEGAEPATEKLNKSQDFHCMLDVIMESLCDVLKNGFLWDLRYRGTTYKDIEFVPYVAFVKCDTDEADLLCGSFKSRMGNVKNLCRYCTCPTQESDLVNANFPKKTVSMLTASVAANDIEGLRGISQQCIDNAFYKIRFSPESSRGIHGACPMEMLHMMLLGIFRYTRDCFFEQIGPTSKLAGDINGLAQHYGVLFGRQSGRDLPKCRFTRGIQAGKLMAKEFRGILLVMAAVLRSTAGIALLKANKNFRNDGDIRAWLLLVEMLLEWEAFLCEPEMTLFHVIRLHKKHRYIMYLLKRVARRQKGMAMKLVKFHAITHLASDIQLFGVPMEVDTGFNESHHKLTKVAARMTQKNAKTFNFQTLTRLDEFGTIDLAMAEVNGRKLCDYYRRMASPPKDTQVPQVAAPSTGGMYVQVFRDQDQQPAYRLGKKQMKTPKPDSNYWDKDVIDFLLCLQELLVTNQIISELEIRTQHCREGQYFRGSPKYRDGYWRDWALIDWGDKDEEEETKTIPGQIWCFVVVKGVDNAAGGAPIIFHGGVQVEDGVYAVVESAPTSTNKVARQMSDLFMPIEKEVEVIAFHNQAWKGKRKFYLADVEALHQPIAVIPDIGAESKTSFFVVKQRHEWVGMFKAWLDDPHEDDVIGPEEPVPSHVVRNTQQST